MKPRIPLVVVLVGLPILFCLLGGLVAYLGFHGPQSTTGGWVRVAEPPAQAAHIAMVGGKYVRVQASDGRLYGCDLHQCNPETFAMPPETVTRVLFVRPLYGNRNTILVETAAGHTFACTSTACSSSFDSGGNSEQPRITPPPAPPGRMVDSGVDTGGTAEIYAQENVLLMDDGRIWYWDYDSWPAPGLICLLPLFAGAGLVLGLLISLGTATVARVRRRNKSPLRAGIENG